jgi:hypothetical protein
VSKHTCQAFSFAAAFACIKFINAHINNALKNISPVDLLPQSYKLTQSHSILTYYTLLPVLP